MLHRLSLPFPLIQSTDDDDESPSDSSRSTPRSSFHLCPLILDIHYADDLRHRPRSLTSFDSGYFSAMGKESPPSLRKPSGTDLRVPLVPINAVADAAQVSPKRDGVIRNLLRKKKKSFTFLSSPDPFPVSPSHGSHVDDPVRAVPFTLSPPRSKPRDPSVDAFEEKDYFVERRDMQHHPYSRDDVPYMLAYDRTLLDNDRFSEVLLKRLNHHHSPSFHDFAHDSPKSILDLGCGTGGWAVEAAEFWPSSQVIGFDIVNPSRLRSGVETPNNVQWKQGNFVKYKLPFPKNTFDLVRMANLSLCIPRDRWEYVLSEARRVLAQGGRLELIDDHLYFPYTKRPPQPSAVQLAPSSFDDDNNDVTKEDAGTERPDGDNINNDDDDDDFVSTKSRFSSLVDVDEDEDNMLPQSVDDPVAERDRNVEDSKSLEEIFEDMLSRKFSIDPRPSKFIDHVFDKIFGRYNQRRLHEFNLYLAPAPGHDSDDSSVGSSEAHGSAGLKKAGKDFAKWVSTVEWDNHKEKDKKRRGKGDRSSGDSVSSFSVVPDTVNAKAAGRLGIKPTPQPSHPHAAQSPGLILWPATFIPIPPFELEMHACKHLHSLIGSKAALVEHFQDIARERQLPHDAKILEDFIWDYESFRRKRFNWPSECPDSHPEDDATTITTTPRSCTFRNSLEPLHQPSPRTGYGNMSPPPDPLFPREKLDFVRCIRVYSATKLDEESHVS